MELEMASNTRHKMPTGRDGGTWAGNFDPLWPVLYWCVRFGDLGAAARVLEAIGVHTGRCWRRRCSSVLARRSRRVAPSACTAASEATGACLKRESTLGGSRGAAGASVATKVLNEYTCPITAEIMTDPVSTLDGFTYERTAITEWLRTNDTSPSTGAKLESKRLIPNVTVRCLLQHL